MQLEIHNLSKRYDEKRGLLPTSFDVGKGELVAIVGHNGAGKSTLLKMLANWIIPDTGRIVVDGIDLGNRAQSVGKIGFVPEVPNLFDAFSVGYNLKLFAVLFRAPLQRVHDILHEFSLLPYQKTKVHGLSKGLKQRVSIGRALLVDPPVLLFDEPTSGLDFDMTKEVYRLLRAMHGEGKTIIFTTHRPEEIRNLATRIMVLHQGSVVFDGGPQLYFASEIHKNLYV